MPTVRIVTTASPLVTGRVRMLMNCRCATSRSTGLRPGTILRPMPWSRCVARGHQHVACLHFAGGRRVCRGGHRHIHAGHGCVRSCRAAVIILHRGRLSVRSRVLRLRGLLGLLPAAGDQGCQQSNCDQGDRHFQGPMNAEESHGWLSSSEPGGEGPPPTSFSTVESPCSRFAMARS